MEPTLFDIVVVIVIGFCLVSSLLKGMIKEIFALAAYGAGYFAAHRFNDISAVYLKDYAGGITGGKVLGFFLVFISVSLVVKFIGSLIQKFMHSAGELSFLDRALGAILGVAKGTFIIAVVLIPIELFPDIDKKITAGSATAPYLKQASGYLKQNLFENETFKKKAGELGLENIEKSIKDFKQVRELQKRLPPPKTDPDGQDIPQDDYSETSKQALENLLKDIQKQ